MKVIRCSDDTYALIADHAGQRHLSLAQAVSELVGDRVISPEYAQEIAQHAETVREVVREELDRTIGEAWKFRGGLAMWVKGMFNLQMATDANVAALCRDSGIEPSRPEPLGD